MRVAKKAWIAVMAGAFLVSACSRQVSTAPAASTPVAALPAGSAQPVVGLALSNAANPFFQELKQGAESAAKENGVTLLTEDAGDDVLRQIAEIRDLISQKVKVLLINPTDADSLTGMIEVANKAGIPVVTLDRSVNHGVVVSHIASDNRAGGKMAGEFIKDRLGKRGGRVVEVFGLPGASASLQRDQGFAESLKAARKLRLVARVEGDFSRERAEQVMTQVLRQQARVDAVFALNDEMAMGVLAALDKAGRKQVVVVGFDASRDGLAAIRAGRLAATIAQRPDLIGWEGVMTARKLIEHSPVESDVPIPLELIKL